MKEIQKKEKILSTVFIIYLSCYVFRLFEYFILRTDKTVLGEAIVHKLIGIGILFIAMKLLHIRLEEIGYREKHCFKNLFLGLAFGMAVFTIAYVAEMLLVTAQGNFDSFQVYVSTYAVDKNLGHQTTILFFLICILGNVINVIMEEGIFRGIFPFILRKKYSFFASAAISSLLFGFWHIVGPIRNYFDGVSGMESTIANILMLVISSALVGFKFALLREMTGTLYMGLGDHFVNNTIVNILHVVSNTGADEFMFVRITIAQSVSFVIVVLFYMRKYYRKNK